MINIFKKITRTYFVRNILTDLHFWMLMILIPLMFSMVTMIVVITFFINTIFTMVVLFLYIPAFMSIIQLKKSFNIFYFHYNKEEFKPLKHLFWYEITIEDITYNEYFELIEHLKHQQINFLAERELIPHEIIKSNPIISSFVSVSGQKLLVEKYVDIVTIKLLSSVIRS